jgi:tetratricopeptide (TPR) repeat protein
MKNNGQLSAQNQGKIQDLFAQGKLNSDKHNFAEVIRNMNDILVIAPDHSGAHFYRGLAKSEMGDKEGAIADYTIATKYDTQFINAYFGLAIQLLKIDKPEKALDNFLKAKGLGCEHPSLDPLIKECQKMMQCKITALSQSLLAAQSITQKLERARKLNDQGLKNHVIKKKYKEAIANYKEAIENDPLFHMAYFNLATIQLEQDNPEEALKNFIKAEDLGSQNLKLIANIEECQQIIQSKTTPSSSSSSAAQLSSPDLGSARKFNQQGLEKRSQKKYDEAITCYKEAIKCAPQFTVAYFNLAALMAEQGETEEALANFQEAEKRGSQNPQLTPNIERCRQKIQSKATSHSSSSSITTQSAQVPVPKKEKTEKVEVPLFISSCSAQAVAVLPPLNQQPSLHLSKVTLPTEPTKKEQAIQGLVVLRGKSLKRKAEDQGEHTVIRSKAVG